MATIGSTAPFVGLFGTVVGIINAFKAISAEKSTGLGAVAGGISEALVTTAIGLFVPIPAVWMYNYFTGRIEAFDVEMGNSSSELIDYFLKRTPARPAPASKLRSRVAIRRVEMGADAGPPWRGRPVRPEFWRIGWSRSLYGKEKGPAGSGRHQRHARWWT